VEQKKGRKRGKKCKKEGEKFEDLRELVAESPGAEILVSNISPLK